MNKTFDIQEFQNRLQTGWLGSEVLYEESLPSTNTYLKRIPAKQFCHGVLAIAEHQTEGRGQYDKKWETEPSANLTFTLGFRPSSADRITLLTLMCAYAIQKALEPYLDMPIKLKWPNDIIAADKKIGGILTECMFYGKIPERVMIGIGLNVNQTVFSPQVDQVATSVALLSKKISREKLLADILTHVEQLYTRWHKQDETLHQEINRQIIGFGKWIKLQIDGEVKEKSYKFLGINNKGQCLVLNEELDVNTFSHEQIRIITDRTPVSRAD